MAVSKAMLRVLRARENVAKKDRWFADVIYNVRIVETEETPTFDTNGICIRFNPKFVMKMANEGTQVEGVFCHEGWHVILDHITRQSGRDGLIWNIACDAVINPMVVRRGWDLPKQRVWIQEVVDRRMSAEKAYEHLRDNAKVITLTRGSEDMKEPGDKGEEKELEDFRRRLDRSIQSATEKAVGNRTISDDVLANLKPDKPHVVITWQEALQDMVDKNRNLDSRTWSRPNRRWLGQGILRPGYMRDKINRLAVAFDVSGSITAHPEYLKEMKGEASRLLAEGIVTSTVLISMDTAVCAKAELHDAEEVIDFDLNARGGGTSFSSGMAEIAKLEDCVGCAFLTDMETSSWGVDPGFPVIWVNWGKRVYPGHQYYPPFGRVINYEELKT